jgi:hypothetical protein
MARKPEYFDVETTGELAKSALRANRRSRFRFLIGFGIVFAVFMTWFMANRRSCQEKAGIGTSDYVPGRKAGREDENAWIVNPSATTARVHIIATGSMQVTVDGIFAGAPDSKSPLKNEPQTVELSPGSHLLAAQIRGAIVQQFLTVHAGEEFRVFFDEAAKDVRFERVVPPKK